MQTTPGRNTLLGSITITHPFHPLRGQTFPILKIRVVNHVHLYSLDTTRGVVCVPEAWTDRRPHPGFPDTPWSPTVIQEWRRLFTIIMQSSEKY